MEAQQLGPYVLIKRLGRGGMGAVYEAEHQETGEHVAVKVLASHLADDLGLKERFDAEIQTLKPLRCPGIAQLIAYGEDEGQPYFAMELVRGQSLERLLRGGRTFTPEEVVGLSIEIARSLKVAHDHGIIHRDLKPANLLVPDDPAQANAGVKLADFGIAKLFGAASPNSSRQYRRNGRIYGTRTGRRQTPRCTCRPVHARLGYVHHDRWEATFPRFTINRNNYKTTPRGPTTGE